MVTLLAAALFLMVVTVGLFGTTIVATARAHRAAMPPFSPAPTYYRNCAEAHANGAYSMVRGEPGYREALDADGDGSACEPYHGG